VTDTRAQRPSLKSLADRGERQASQAKQAAKQSGHAKPAPVESLCGGTLFGVAKPTMLDRLQADDAKT